MESELEALKELSSRLRNAQQNLLSLARDHENRGRPSNLSEAARLHGKASGVALAISYTEDTIALLTEQRQAR